MITTYYRPDTLEAALELLGREDPPAVPLAGGTVLSQPGAAPFAAVDLQALGLDSFSPRGKFLDLGATLTLQRLLDSLEQLEAAPPAPVDGLRRAIQHEAAYNLRQAATVAGTLVSAGGRSPFATAMLALDAALTLLPAGDEGETLALGDLLPLRGQQLRRRLITQVTVPLNAGLVYAYVARSPADQAIVCAAVAKWPSGRTRVALGGWGDAPRLAFDGMEPDGAAIAARSAYRAAGDEWASAEYRAEVAAILVDRALGAG